MIHNLWFDKIPKFDFLFQNIQKFTSLVTTTRTRSRSANPASSA